jgi:hypothetical protein
MTDSRPVLILSRTKNTCVPQVLASFSGAKICRKPLLNDLHNYSEYDPGEFIYIDGSAGMISCHQTDSNSIIKKIKHDLHLHIY